VSGINLTKKSKLLALILRHKPEQFDITLDAEGYANVSDLLDTGKFTMEMLEEIVSTGPKIRYAFDITGEKVRAMQGHSIEVDLKLQAIAPPEILYHGTPPKNIDSIMKNGLNKGNRQYVHLSADENTAEVVGKRRGSDPAILVIDALKLHNDGHPFYLAENGVWLTDNLDALYVKRIIW
jgi:putative RNA 2'-phosphotransferase